ncbi:KilA-N domain-containing protein, partial [Citrobacter braakii]|uniref:KilA-N domain-containing protein n=1 Tax=Citrobacter braakii TaxID=57706 RepID=UPI001FFF3E40
MNTTNEVNVPVIAGVEITTDGEGRFNLNAIHKASGQGQHKRPSKWTETKQAKELMTELEGNLLKNNQSPNSGSGQKVLHIVNGGTSPGTFAHELLAIEYAGWISPAFRLQVNQTFLDYRTGKLTQPVGINEQLLQELLFQMRENQEYQRREITKLRLELAQLQTERNLPMSATIDQQLLRERDELAERLGRSRNYATLDAVERKMGREYQWHRLRNWCLRNNVEPLVLRKFQCVHAWPRGAWLDAYG